MAYRTAQLPAPTLFERLVSAIAPLRMICVVVYHGFVPACKVQLLSNPSIWNLLSLSVWWNTILSFGFPVILKESDQDSAANKFKLMEPCHGLVLEIGAGQHSFLY